MRTIVTTIRKLNTDTKILCHYFVPQLNISPELQLVVLLRLPRSSQGPINMQGKNSFEPVKHSNCFHETKLQ